MKLSTALRLTGSSTVALVGAGGKTSALFQLARELSPCIVTTTTHLGAWQVKADLPADSEPDKRIETDEVSQAKMRSVIWTEGESLPDIEPIPGSGITIVTGTLDESTNRYRGLSTEQLSKLRELAGYHDLPLLIEADGARQHPLKGPAEHEPAIPDFVDTVVVVAGLFALGKILNDEHVHRPEIFSKLSGLSLGEVITTEALAKVLMHPEGGLKNIPQKARRVVLLNQADTLELQAIASQIARELLFTFQAVCVCSLQSQKVFATHEKIAGVILAAGESKRFGQPKQLLDYRGQPFIRVVAEKALAAGLNPVVVVQGATDLHAALESLNVNVIQNDDWREGQASSIRAGIKALTQPPPSLPQSHESWERSPAGMEGVGGIIFLLADQPQVTVEIMRALIERHAQTLEPVIAPYVLDKRANPVLFDRITFDDLMKLTGDIGGRGIFSKFSPRYVNWYDQRLLLDVDTPEDYQRLIGDENE